METRRIINVMGKKFYLNLQKAIQIALSLTLPSPEDVLLFYLEDYYNQGDGQIVPINVHKSACDAADTIKYISYNYTTRLNGSIDEPSCMMTGTLAKDIDYVNSDPYPTAGGYKKGIARKGTPCKVFLSYSYVGFRFEIKCDVSIIVDHYNNNFYGVSTGNGTRKFNEGERMENQTVYAHSKLSHGLIDLIELDTVDCTKISDFIYSQK